MIDSDCKSQSYNSKYTILSHNVLICLSKLLGQQDKNVGLGKTFSFKLKIIILTALVQKLWSQTYFHEMVENIMYP